MIFFLYFTSPQNKFLDNEKNKIAAKRNKLLVKVILDGTFPTRAFLLVFVREWGGGKEIAKQRATNCNNSSFSAAANRLVQAFAYVCANIIEAITMPTIIGDGFSTFEISVGGSKSLHYNRAKESEMRKEEIVCVKIKFAHKMHKRPRGASINYFRFLHSPHLNLSEFRLSPHPM